MYYTFLMRIKYSQHAKEQIKYRGISLLNIRKSIKFPDKVISSYKSRWLYRKKFGKRILEVVIVEEGSIIVVVTSYYIYEN